MSTCLKVAALLTALALAGCYSSAAVKNYRGEDVPWSTTENIENAHPQPISISF